MIDGSQPAADMERILAIGAFPSSFAFSADMTRSAAAPSEMAEELPAVIVPFFGSKAGLSAASPSSVVSGRITSS